MSQLFSLQNKVAIVTGAARGNGKAIADGFVEAGAIVYYCDILERELANAIQGKSEQCVKSFIIDINSKVDLERLVDRVFQEQGKVDILVNNAGISISESSEAYSVENWHKTLSTNLSSPFFLSQLAAKSMIKQRKGSIINITSLGAEQGFPNNPAYIASKGGLKQLSKALAYDWAQYNIRVNSIGPGYINTELNKKSWNNSQLRGQRTDRTLCGRWGEPDDLVGAAIFLSSDASKYITGQDIYVDGGWLAKGI